MSDALYFTILDNLMACGDKQKEKYLSSLKPEITKEFLEEIKKRHTIPYRLWLLIKSILWRPLVRNVLWLLVIGGLISILNIIYGWFKTNY